MAALHAPGCQRRAPADRSCRAASRGGPGRCWHAGTSCSTCASTEARARELRRVNRYRQAVITWLMTSCSQHCRARNCIHGMSKGMCQILLAWACVECCCGQRSQTGVRLRTAHVVLVPVPGGGRRVGRQAERVKVQEQHPSPHLVRPAAHEGVALLVLRAGDADSARAGLASQAATCSDTASSA